MVGQGNLYLISKLGKTIDSSEIENNSITNADINASAAIAQSKLSLDISNSDINASAAIAQSKLSLDIVNANINSSAAIAQSKLSLDIVNANINSSAAIANSKLNTIGIAKGGSGQTTQQAALNALTNISSATAEYVLTKDTSTGNATFKVAGGGAEIWELLTYG